MMENPRPTVQREVPVRTDGEGPAFGTLTLPDVSDFDGVRPWVFFVPPETESDAELAIRLHELTELLVRDGYAFYRFATSHPLGEKQILAHFRAARDQARLERSRFVLIGLAEGANRIAEHYYEFLPFGEPAAIVLLGPTIPTHALNQITCPMLILHAGVDEEIVAAVEHHRNRFTDSTAGYHYGGLGPLLGEQQFDARVVQQVQSWLNHAMQRGHRPQEPVISGPSRKLA
jgi:hypothetical protein